MTCIYEYGVFVYIQYMAKTFIKVRRERQKAAQPEMGGIMAEAQS